MSAAPSPLKAAILAHFAGGYIPFYEKHLQDMKPEGKELNALCPFHADKNPSLSVNPETGLWHCHAGCGGGDVFDFYGKLTQVNPKAQGGFKLILEGIARDHGINAAPDKAKVKPRITAQYDYTDEAGKQLFQVVRLEPKSFRQRRPDGKGGWIWNLEGVEPVLYNLPQAVKSPAVILVEGEKDVETLRPFGLVATSNPMGAGKWRDSYAAALAGKDVVVIPDNDFPGQDHARTVALSVLDKARSVKIVLFPEYTPLKFDVSDFISTHKDGPEAGFKALADLIDKAPVLSDSDAVQKLHQWALSGIQALKEKQTDNAAREKEKAEREAPEKAWKKARELFPLTPFPWQVLPPAISESLQELARSIATSPTALPGAAFAILASTLGRTVRIVAKESWKEPLIFWCADIRESGEGKTPAMRKLLGPLYAAQNEVDKEYKAKKAEWDATKKDERGPEPFRPRGYYATDLTLEGLRGEVATGHGGLVSIQDELSAWLSAQNQYKKGGNDRESWLVLFDGNPARHLRSKETISIKGARVSLCGGIQPFVWARFFAGEDGLFMEDGTVFRLLVTYEPPQFFPLTAESWSAEKRMAWETALERSMQWANRRTNGDEVETLDVVLSEPAWNIFCEWRNGIYQEKPNLPPCLRGFIPKAVTYAIRLGGILRLMEDFSEGRREPAAILTAENIQRGIDAACFYMAHAVNAMQTLSGETVSPPAAEDKARRLAEVLESLRNDLDHNRLAVGFIKDIYSKNCPPGLEIETPKAMGAFLRACGLLLVENQSANGKRGVSCLHWNQETENFISSKKHCLQSLQACKSEENQGNILADIEKPKSAKPATPAPASHALQTLRTSENQSLLLEPLEKAEKNRLADVAGIFSTENLCEADGYPGKVVEI